MDRKIAYRLSDYIGIDPFKDYEIPEKEVDIQVSELDLILKEIFSVDPQTGSPRGDIVYYLSDKGNPQIKDWLLNNLMKSRPASQSPEDLTDDIIEEMSRHADESVSDYSARLQGLYESASAELQKLNDPNLGK